MSTNYEAPHYAVFSNLPLLHTSLWSKCSPQQFILKVFFSLHSSSTVTDQVLHSYKATAKIIVLYIFNLNF